MPFPPSETLARPDRSGLTTKTRRHKGRNAEDGGRTTDDGFRRIGHKKARRGTKKEGCPRRTRMGTNGQKGDWRFETGEWGRGSQTTEDSRQKTERWPRKLNADFLCVLVPFRGDSWLATHHQSRISHHRARRASVSFYPLLSAREGRPRFIHPGVRGVLPRFRAAE